MPDREAVFFRTPADWRAWLEAHAVHATELRVGFHKRGSGETCITWPEAWDLFQGQAPSYRKAALWWVVNAKRAETRERRLATLIEDSAAGRRVGHLQRQVGRA